MKNIHILHSKKPTKLVLNHNNELCFNDTRYLKEYKNIHITSDEEIKRGDWFMALDGTDDYYKANEIFLEIIREDIKRTARKIILTTEQDLIDDGVQAIDDELLKLFVKNHTSNICY